MILRRWESWVVMRRGDRYRERRLRRHFTERGALAWAERLAYSPEVILKTFESALEGPDERGISHLTLVEPHARRRVA